MLHLIKLAVGSRSLADLAAWQSCRTPSGTPVEIRTRQYPKRAPELVAGGSLYWVVAGLASVRQPIVEIREIRREDGARATAIMVGPALVAVMPRAVRAFQGWRYLRSADAPLDLGPEADGMPGELRRRLAELCLL